jgi:hypothetical protein
MNLTLSVNDLSKGESLTTNICPKCTLGDANGVHITFPHNAEAASNSLPKVNKLKYYRVILG